MSVVLALYPNFRGFGFAVLRISNNENTCKLIDRGIISVRPVNNEKVLKRIHKYTDYFKPKVVILRDFDLPPKRGRRISELIESIIHLVKEKQLPVYRYTREQIRFAFEQYGAKTKYEIAQKIIEGFPQLAKRAPKVTKWYDEEDYNMGIFDALALALTHQYLAE